MNWQPVTHNDQAAVPASRTPLPFVLDEVDRAQAIAARYYIQQHVQHLNARASTKEPAR